MFLIILCFLACLSNGYCCCDAYSQNEEHSIPVTCVTDYAIACVSCCNVGCWYVRCIVIENDTCLCNCKILKIHTLRFFGHH